MNGININRFQFEYDLTWMSFFQNHRGETYLRFGGREDAGPETHLTKDSLIQAMNTALELHRSKMVKPTNRYEPSGEPSLTPEQLPITQKMLANRKNKCIHCHDIKTAQLRELRSKGQLKKEMVFSYPSPSNLGIRLDPVNQSTIQSIEEGSVAFDAGLRAGDVLQSLDRQPVFSFADATRVLELTPETGKLNVVAHRVGQDFHCQIDLSDQWRAAGDPSWRDSTHLVGPNSGFWGVRQDADQKSRLKLGAGKLAIKVTAIWGKWAKQAGIQQGDIVIMIDGVSDDMHIRQLQSYLQMKKNWGETIGIMVLRQQQPVELTMKLPDEPTEE